VGKVKLVQKFTFYNNRNENHINNKTIVQFNDMVR